MKRVSTDDYIENINFCNINHIMIENLNIGSNVVADYDGNNYGIIEVCYLPECINFKL